MPLNNDLTVPETPGVDRDHPVHGHRNNGNQFTSRRIRGTHQHPQIRSLIAEHCDQLSSELADVFRTEVEREVRKRVSEVIVSEATALCEQLRSKDEALLAAETRCKGLQEQLELSDQMCHHLQERVTQLEATEAELRAALDRGLKAVRSFHPLRLCLSFTRFSRSSRWGLVRPN